MLTQNRVAQIILPIVALASFMLGSGDESPWVKQIQGPQYNAVSVKDVDRTGVQTRGHGFVSCSIQESVENGERLVTR